MAKFLLLVNMFVPGAIPQGFIYSGSATQTPEQVAATIVSGQGLTWYGWYANCITYSGSSCSTPGNGSTVTTWDDESGNANNLSCSGGTSTFNTNQVNSLPAVNVSGTNCALTTGFTPPHVTVFWVLSVTSPSTTQDLMGNNTAGSGVFGYGINASKQRMTKVGTADLINGTATLSASTYYQLAGNYDGSTANLWKGSSTDGTASTSQSFTGTTANFFSATGDSAFAGGVALCFVFTGSAVVNSTNTTNMLAALHARYGT